MNTFNFIERQKLEKEAVKEHDISLSSIEDDKSTVKDKVDAQMGELLSPVFY